MRWSAWRASGVGIYRSTLRQRIGLGPGQIRMQMTRLEETLRRFCRERTVALPRSVVVSTPLQHYFIDPNFAAAVHDEMFAGGE